MTFEVDLFKLSEDTKAIFLQLVDFSTDDEVPRRNFSTSELTFHMEREDSQDTTGKVDAKSELKITEENQKKFDLFVAEKKKSNPAHQMRIASLSKFLDQRAEKRKSFKLLMEQNSKPKETDVEDATESDD
eukprot:GHVP01051222.1.p1 GENE.GHVP01051222.1~~GHVP01051222.1.p1  ORF type:complete len:141 (+),score=36.84 GHVP01051222.1:32-424(+)